VDKHTAEENFQTKNSALPRVAVTMGDAAGIGAEITLKALTDESLREICLPIIVGDTAFLKKTARDLELKFDFVEAFENPLLPTSRIAVYDLNNLKGEFATGADSAVAGKAAAEYIETAVNLWREKKIDAIATAPISKRAIALGGYDYPGHTEFLAELTATKEFAMSFFAEDLRVVLLSTHVSLRDAIELVKKEKLIELIKFSHREISKLLKRDARIAVAGLNPHASEGGMFGAEEAAEIVPAISECRERFGINVTWRVFARHDFSARIQRRIRRSDFLLSRPGDDRRQVSIVRRVGQRHARSAAYQNFG
jgi:4-hydroxythreonine-4-phosphate dehydrogenase